MEIESAPKPAPAVAKPPPGPPNKPKTKWVPPNSQPTLKFGSPTAVVKAEPAVKTEPETAVAVKEEPKANGVEKSPKKKKKSKGSDSDGAKKKKKKSKGSDSDGEKKKKKKEKEDEDPERALRKERKRKLKEMIKENKRKDKKRKRSQFISEESEKNKSKKHSDDEKEVDTEDEEITPEDVKFMTTHPSDEESEMAEGDTTESDDESEESGSDGEKEERRQSKRLSHDSAKDIKHGDGEGEVAEATEAEKEMESALKVVGSRATQNKDKKKDKEEKKPRKRGNTKVCGYCDKDIPENWKQDRGENTGTGKTWVYFHEQCQMPFLEESKKLRDAGKKPLTAKGKKKDEKKEKLKAKLKESSTEEKPQREKKEKPEEKPKKAKEKPKPKDEKRGEGGEPAAKKAKPGPGILEMIDAVGKARENYDRWVTCMLDHSIPGADLDQIALRLETFLREWKVMDTAMQEIEDDKRKPHDIPAWPFKQGFQLTYLFFHLMDNERGFNRFRALARKSVAKPETEKKTTTS
jgi:hypothetical protein